ncbi:MAG: peptidoglycan DD-metalloendopeptidase family protein [Clostridia bacterium]|nr:peptidoglycan DD-metalloendopeptidase family protein [Clostridia bacterium]
MKTKTNKILRSTALIAMALAILISFVRFDCMIVFAEEDIDTSEEREKELEDKISSLQSEQKNIKEKIESNSNEQSSQLEKKSYLDSLAQSTQTEINATKELIEEYAAKIEAKSVEISTKEAEIEEKYQLVLKRLKFAYEEGTMSYVEILLDADSLEDFLVSEERVGAVLEYDRDLIVDMNLQLQQLEAEKADLDETKEAQEILKSNLVAKEAQLEKEAQDVANYINQLKLNSEAYQKQLDEAKADQEKLNAEIEELLKERQRKRKSSFTGGYFEYPLPNSCTRISSYYGYRAIFGDFHLGVDFPAPYGTPVYAAADGEVIWSSYKGSYGYCVMIDHGGGYSTLYGHNSSLVASVGDYVKKGDVISKVGSTGNSTGNHLHFEVRINGKTVNPLGYINVPGN